MGSRGTKAVIRTEKKENVVAVAVNNMMERCFMRNGGGKAQAKLCSLGDLEIDKGVRKSESVREG